MRKEQNGTRPVFSEIDASTTAPSPKPFSVKRHVLIASALVVLLSTYLNFSDVVHKGRLYLSPEYGDEWDYEAIAWNLARGRGFGYYWSDPEWRGPYENQNQDGRYNMLLARSGSFQSTAYRPPLFPVLLALLYKLAGRNFALWRVVNCAIVGLATGFTFAIGYRLGGWAGGLLAALLSLLDPLPKLHANLFMTEGLAMLVISALSWSILNLFLRPDIGRYMVTGVLLALAILTRNIFVLWVQIVFALALWIEIKLSGGRGRRSLLMLGAMLLVLMPWFVRNCIVLQAFMPLGTQGGIELSAGYSDGAVYMDGVWFTDTRDYACKCFTSQMKGIFRERDQARFSLAKAKEWILNNPHLAARLAYLKMISLWRPGSRYQTFLLTLIIIGLLILWRRKEAMVLYGLLAANTLAVGLTWSVGGRFLVPVLSIIHSLAATVLWKLFIWIFSQKTYIRIKAFGKMVGRIGVSLQECWAVYGTVLAKLGYLSAVVVVLLSFTSLVLLLSFTIARGSPAISQTIGETVVKVGDIEVLPAERPMPLAAEPQPQNRVEMNINDELVFLGYDLSERTPRPGDQLKVVAYWQSLRKTNRDYAIQMELRNGGYKLRETLDIAPTRLWEEGKYYRGSAMIAIHPYLLGGTYSLNLRLERDDGIETQVSLTSLDIPYRRQHIIERSGEADYRGDGILSPDEPLFLRLKDREALELVAGWTGKAMGEETRVEVYISNIYWRKYLGTWVIRSGRYTLTKRRIPKFLTVPGQNVIELRVPEVKERVHNVGWRGVVDSVFPDLLQDPRTGYDGPIQIDFAQVSTPWEGNWDDYYDLAEVYAERGMMGEVARLYEEAVDKGVEPRLVDEFALFRRAYRALGEKGKLEEIEERIAERISHKMSVNLGGKVEFLGYSLTKLNNDCIKMSFFFRCLEKIEKDYTLWVHGEVEDESLLEGVNSSEGYVILDHPLPTSRWEVGEIYEDDQIGGLTPGRYHPTLGPIGLGEMPDHAFGLRPGRYHFTLGLWRPEDGSRLWREKEPNAHVIDLGWVEAVEPF